MAVGGSIAAGLMLDTTVSDALVGLGGKSWASPGMHRVGILLQLHSPWGELLDKGGGFFPIPTRFVLNSVVCLALQVYSST